VRLVVLERCSRICITSQHHSSCWRYRATLIATGLVCHSTLSISTSAQIFTFTWSSSLDFFHSEAVEAHGTDGQEEEDGPVGTMRCVTGGRLCRMQSSGGSSSADRIMCLFATGTAANASGISGSTGMHGRWNQELVMGPQRRCA
jgi:hypothetical protein